MTAKIPFITLDGQRDTTLNKTRDFTWNDIVSFFKDHLPSDVKEVEGFMPVVPVADDKIIDQPRPSGGTSQRVDANIAAISMLVLDLDEEGAYDIAKEKFAAYDHLVYSTFSHNENAPYKLRMMLRLDQPIPIKEWEECFHALVSDLPSDIQCGNPSRFYYYPTVNTASTIPPVFIENKGIALTKDDILGMHNEQGMNAEWVKEQEKRKKMAGGIRDYRGEYHSVAQRPKGYSYEDYIERHAKPLEDLRRYPSARHKFAAAVTMSEIARFKEHADPKTLIEFVMRACEDVGQPPLYSSGDTLAELIDTYGNKGLIFSAYLKSGMEKCPNHINRQYLQQCANAGTAASKSKNWSFEPDKNYLPQEMTYDYAGIRSRNLPAMKSLMENGNIIDFCTNVLANEVSINPEGAKLSFVGQFIFKTAASYYEKQHGLADATKTRALNAIADKSDTIANEVLAKVGNAVKDHQQFKGFVDMALGFGMKTSMNNEFVFEGFRKQNNRSYANRRDDNTPSPS
ncbi:hypothetical protein [Neptuniibacter sp. QD37_11]|uniref:hypothetical protein n=1 Tax=Neptuniibacter sp. QD37_11 TaxID=3398209 RepID=UPI0039F4BBEF